MTTTIPDAQRIEHDHLTRAGRAALGCQKSATCGSPTGQVRVFGASGIARAVVIGRVASGPDSALRHVAGGLVRLRLPSPWPPNEGQDAAHDRCEEQKLRQDRQVHVESTKGKKERYDSHSTQDANRLTAGNSHRLSGYDRQPASFQIAHQGTYRSPTPRLGLAGESR